jgi:hypothetical protein
LFGQVGQVVEVEPPDGERLVVVDPGLAADGAAAERDRHVVADVGVGVDDLRGGGHGGDPLRTTWTPVSS